MLKIAQFNKYLLFKVTTAGKCFTLISSHQWEISNYHNGSTYTRKKIQKRTETKDWKNYHQFITQTKVSVTILRVSLPRQVDIRKRVMFIDRLIELFFYLLKNDR